MRDCCQRGGLAVLVALIGLAGGSSRAAADGLDALYGRIASDLAAGAPLRVRVYVALCDNDSQGIVPVKNPAICDGERPARNIYWGTSGGLGGFLARQRWRPQFHELLPDGPVIIRARWRKVHWAGGGLRRAGAKRRVPVEIEAVVYRGRSIRRAMADYIADVHDAGSDAGGPHVVGYIGHNYLLDTDDDLIPGGAAGARGEAVGAFALSCYGNSDIRPSITTDGVAVLLLNRGLTYPGAWTVGGLIEGLARGVSPRRLHALAADAFAEGKQRPPGSMRAVFAYGAP